MFEPKNLRQHIAATYKALRLGVAVIAFVFPLLLWIGGIFVAGLALEGSMSAYYHAGNGAMRNWFVEYCSRSAQFCLSTKASPGWKIMPST